MLHEVVLSQTTCSEVGAEGILILVFTGPLENSGSLAFSFAVHNLSTYPSAMVPWRAALWLGLIAKSAEAENWAVLVAGSSGFWNYRHQVGVKKHHLLIARLSTAVTIQRRATMLMFAIRLAGCKS